MNRILLPVFHYWKKKYGLSHPYTKHTEPTGDSFIPLNINHTPAIPTSSCGDRHVTIELPSGIKDPPQHPK